MALKLEHICKRYGDAAALSQIDFQIEPGEIVALLGANGAGKTTLLSVAAGLSRPDCGGIWVEGIDMLTQPARGRRHIGFAPQEIGVYPTLSVRDNLRFFGELVGLRRRVLAHRVAAAAADFGLLEMLDRPARVLSAGQARRLNTAMILLRRPSLLLLDEPTSGVDVGSRARMLELVRRLAEDGSAICWSTHYLVEAEQLGASIAIIDRGRIIARGSSQSLIGAHGHSGIELHFEGAAPTLASADVVRSSPSSLRIAVDREPESHLAGVLAMLGDAAGRLRAVKVIQPDLESVFRNLTERTPRATAAEAEARRDPWT